MPARHKGIPSPSMIDQKWPFQVAIQDDLCTARNLTMIMAFCRENGLEHQTRHVIATWPGWHKQINYRLHCFADLASAELFRSLFGGEPFDPRKEREGGRARGAWRRTDTYHRLVELGPLSVPMSLRN
jgi:hypothetical protein